MIEAKQLTMTYGSTVAVKEASFKASKGEIVGLLGPNGAGKTTCMNILATQIVPTSGTATVGGYDIHEDPIEIRRLVGYLPEVNPLYGDMEVVEYLQFVGEGRNLQENGLKERLTWVVENCKIKEVYRRPLGELSRGYQQRVGLAQALIHDPEVLILDEPTSGLDPLQIIEIRNLIRRLAKDKTIIFSTHIMQEASATSDRIVIINEGEIIADGTAEELQARVDVSPMTILSVKAEKEGVKKALETLSGCRSFKLVKEEDGLLTYRLEASTPEGLWEQLAALIRDNHWVVKELKPQELSLEDTFIALTKASRGPTVER
ncbi:MAG: ABC transporter ATP-binding protein [Candidatus Zixiibacteriota bacterium]